ncbi:helix-turn-helix domain-containing protein [Streptomyces sp. NPDC088732]|uniref:helix-turn-helix domain-containing protein n=1 Tax=Streptomyces sp. NPDC088732 TaxID=3365879 RepID=UPI003815486B
MTQPTDGSTPTERFGARVADAARSAGYDIDGRGGKAALSRDTGMSPTTIGRMLDGKRLPDPQFFEPLAKAIRVNPFELFVEAGLISPETLRSLSETQPSRVRSHPTTPAQAAEELGITDPYGREMFLGVVERLRRQQDQSTPDSDHGGGVAAEQ